MECSFQDCYLACIDFCFSQFTVYDTPKFIRFKNQRTAIWLFLLRLAIVGYIFIYSIGYEKGYQFTEAPQSGVVTKVKGVASTMDREDLPEIYRRVWDVADYIIPPQQNGAIFVMTNAILTYNQTQGTCQEDPELNKCKPSDPNACPKGGSAKNGNGIYTGKCKQSDVDSNVNTCEIQAWCPVERLNQSLFRKALLPQVYNFTLSIKNSIEFPQLKEKRRNLIHDNETYLQNCHYNEKTAPYCPVFQIGYIIERAKANFTDLSINGGIISIVLKWYCDFNTRQNYCTLNYEFSRVDEINVKPASGYNFRYANSYHTSNGQSVRDLIKAYGINFVITVEGEGGRFYFFPFILKIGAGCGLFSLATFIAEKCLAVDFIFSTTYRYVRDLKYPKTADKATDTATDTTEEEREMLINNQGQSEINFRSVKNASLYQYIENYIEIELGTQLKIVLR